MGHLVVDFLWKFEISDSATLPCKAGGTCLEKTNDYTCVCPTGYSGMTCEIDENKTVEAWWTMQYSQILKAHILFYILVIALLEFW